MSVIVDLAAFAGTAGGRCETERFGPIGAEAARRIACDCGVSRVVLDGDSEPLDVGRKTRTVPAAIRRALVIRDGHCQFPGCDRPAAWCDGHHLRHWVDGGPTSLDNLVLLCRRHHRLVHEGRYRIQRHTGGIVDASRPDGTPIPRARAPDRSAA